MSCQFLLAMKRFDFNDCFCAAILYNIYLLQIQKQFQNLSSLEYLDLAENWLENVPPTAFQGLYV